VRRRQARADGDATIYRAVKLRAQFEGPVFWTPKTTQEEKANRRRKKERPPSGKKGAKNELNPESKSLLPTAPLRHLLSESDVQHRGAAGIKSALERSAEKSAGATRTDSDATAKGQLIAQGT